MKAKIPVATRRSDERKRHPHERPEPGRTVDQRGLLELQRYAADEPAQRPDRERQDKDQVGQREADDAVGEVPPIEHLEGR